MDSIHPFLLNQFLAWNDRHRTQFNIASGPVTAEIPWVDPLWFILRSILTV